MAYLITEPAEVDIDEILAYIADDNLTAALSVYDRLTHCLKCLLKPRKPDANAKNSAMMQEVFLRETI
jgi:plasmid stabilization system protein ParE